MFAVLCILVCILDLVLPRIPAGASSCTACSPGSYYGSTGANGLDMQGKTSKFGIQGSGLRIWSFMVWILPGYFIVESTVTHFPSSIRICRVKHAAGVPIYRIGLAAGGASSTVCVFCPAGTYTGNAGECGCRFF